ncbi:hypothetical protein A8144_02560 [Mycobacterium leprae 3125609]|nr:hypothetical protein A8144_02560 [Mycobacterium leprae 3125609]OAX70374.1 hypothetical protein A3216_12425 [Mycobacterium leprae 7935681]
MRSSPYRSIKPRDSLAITSITVLSGTTWWRNLGETEHYVVTQIIGQRELRLVVCADRLTGQVSGKLVRLTLG